MKKWKTTGDFHDTFMDAIVSHFGLPLPREGKIWVEEWEEGSLRAGHIFDMETQKVARSSVEVHPVCDDPSAEGEKEFTVVFSIPEYIERSVTIVARVTSVEDSCKVEVVDDGGLTEWERLRVVDQIIALFRDSDP